MGCIEAEELRNLQELRLKIRLKHKIQSKAESMTPLLGSVMAVIII
jgi:hypothetical protein